MSLSNVATLCYIRATATSAVATGISSGAAVEVPSAKADTAWQDGTGGSTPGSTTPPGVQLIWTDQRSYDTTGVTYDLSALTAAATNTGACTPTAIKAIRVRNESASGNLVVGNAASTQFVGPLSAATATYTLPPGGELMFTNMSAAGWDCATAKSLKIVASVGTVTGTLTILALD